MQTKLAIKQYPDKSKLEYLLEIDSTDYTIQNLNESAFRDALNKIYFMYNSNVSYSKPLVPNLSYFPRSRIDTFHNIEYINQFYLEHKQEVDEITENVLNRIYTYTYDFIKDLKFPLQIYRYLYMPLQSIEDIIKAEEKITESFQDNLGRYWSINSKESTGSGAYFNGHEQMEDYKSYLSICLTGMISDENLIDWNATIQVQTGEPELGEIRLIQNAILDLIHIKITLYTQSDISEEEITDIEKFENNLNIDTNIQVLMDEDVNFQVKA
jgi:hypothetical protein